MATLYTGLDSSSFFSKAVVGDPRKEIITNGIDRPIWWDGVVARELGVDVPLVAAADETTRPAGSLTLTSTYIYVFIYKRSLDGALGNQSPSVSITLASAENGIRLNIPADSNLQTGIDTVVVYRTQADGSSLFYDGEKAYSCSLITYDSTVADSALGEAIETDNDIPPARPYADAMWDTAILWGSITYITGTVAVTNGAQGITFTDAAITKAMEGKSFRAGADSKFYTITVGSVNVGAQTANLDVNYEGSTNSGLSYTISLDPMFAAWSKIDSSGTPRPDAWPVANTDKISGANNEKAVGIGKSRNAIILFSDFAGYGQNFLSANTRTAARKLFDIGAASNRLITNETMTGDCLFMSKGLDILRTNGSPSEPANLTGSFIHKILNGKHDGIHRNLRHNLAKIANAHMMFYPDRKWLMFFFCMGTSATYPKACLIGDLNINPYGNPEGPSPWMLWTLPTEAVSAWLTPDGNGILRPWYGDDLGFYWLMDDDTVDNDGVPSGTVTGTATGITATKLTDTGAAFYTTGNGLKGVMLRTYDSDNVLTNEVQIASNNATSITIAAWDSQPTEGVSYEIGGIVMQRYTKTETHGMPENVTIPIYLSMSFDKALSTGNLTVYRYKNKSSTAETTAGQNIDAGSDPPHRIRVKQRGFVNQFMFEHHKPNEKIVVTDWTLKALKGGNK